MKPLQHVLTLLVVLAISSYATASEPLVWKWEQGDSARYLMTQGMTMAVNAGPAGNMTTETEQKMFMNWTVESVDESGEAVLSQKMDRITMNTQSPMGQNIEYDSASEEPHTGLATLVAPLLDALVGSPILATMHPTGEYTDIEISDELADAFKRMPSGAMSADMLTQMVKQGSVTFPEESIEAGYSWQQESEIQAPQVGKMLVTTSYTYNGPKEVDGKTLESFTPSITMKVAEGGDQPFEIEFITKKSTGEILFDRELGRIVSSEIVQEMEINVTVQGKVITNQMTQTVKLKALAEGEEASSGGSEETFNAETSNDKTTDAETTEAPVTVPAE